MPRRFLPVILVLVAAACGSSGGGPSGPPEPSPTPLGPPTATMTTSGMQPQVLHTFDFHETITFVNADSRPHDVRSDPHPAHTDCPAMNAGILQPGERREIPGPSLPRFTLCFYHDETDPTNDAYRGVVVTH
jgi:hypothetical protein